MIRRFYIMPLNHRATPERIAEFVAVYDACDLFIPGLTASAAGLDLGGTTVIWENLFTDEDTYSGPYMLHPYHAASLDSYLMGDSPELLTHDTFTVRYEYEGDAPKLDKGIRRLVLMKLDDEAAAAAAAFFAAPHENVATSVFSADNVKWVSPKGKAWTHILEQGFADRDALDAYLLTTHGIATTSKDGLRRVSIAADDLKVYAYPFALKSQAPATSMPPDDTPVLYALTARVAADDVEAYVALLEEYYDPHMADLDGRLVQRMRTVTGGYLEAEVQSIWELPSVAAYNPVRFKTGADPRWGEYVRGAIPLVKGGSRRFWRTV